MPAGTCPSNTRDIVHAVVTIGLLSIANFEYHADSSVEVVADFMKE